MRDLAEVRSALTGPVPSVLTPFTQKGEIDYKGLNNQIDATIKNGAKIIFLTPGDSHFFCLTPKEMGELGKAIVTAAKKHEVLSVVCDKHFSTPQALEYAKYLKEIGADLYMPYPPDWGRSMTVETLTGHYLQISKHMQLMLLFTPLASGDQGIKNFEQLFAKTDRIMAIKDDICAVPGRKLSMLFHDRCAILSGGQKQNHLNAYHYGLDGYLSTFQSFCPKIAYKYWNAICKSDYKTAVEMIKLDNAFFDYVMPLPGGFDAGIHGALEIFGICKRWRRAPYYNLNDEEMGKLKDFFIKNKFL